MKKHTDIVGKMIQTERMPLISNALVANRIGTLLA